MHWAILKSLYHVSTLLHRPHFFYYSHSHHLTTHLYQSGPLPDSLYDAPLLNHLSQANPTSCLNLQPLAHHPIMSLSLAWLVQPSRLPRTDPLKLSDDVPCYYQKTAVYMAYSRAVSVHTAPSRSTKRVILFVGHCLNRLAMALCLQGSHPCL